MRVANKVVEAPAVAALYRSRISWWVVSLLILAAAIAMVVALMVSDVGGIYARPGAAVVERARRLGQGALRMISMRYHIVSLAAVFLALALGIVLGATKISSPLLNEPGGRQRRRSAASRTS